MSSITGPVIVLFGHGVHFLQPGFLLNVFSGHGIHLSFTQYIPGGHLTKN